MPAPVAFRRWDNSAQESLSPIGMYSPTQRYAIVALGIVIAVSVVPYGILPAVLSGQLAVLSATLKVGDKYP